MLQRASLLLGAAAAFFAVQMANFAMACDSCLLHEAAVPVPPSGNEVIAQPAFLPVALAGVIGIALVCAVVYGTKRMYSQKERG